MRHVVAPRQRSTTSSRSSTTGSWYDSSTANPELLDDIVFGSLQVILENKIPMRMCLLQNCVRQPAGNSAKVKLLCTCFNYEIVFGSLEVILLK